MASTLHVSEGHVIDDEGNRIATLSDLGEAERLTAIEERLTKLENAAAVEPTEPTPGTPFVPTTLSGSPDDVPSPPGGPLKVHVGDEVATPEAVSPEAS